MKQITLAELQRDVLAAQNIKRFGLQKQNIYTAGTVGI